MSSDSQHEYRLIMPPVIAPIQEVSRQEALTFFNWFVGIIPQRLKELDTLLRVRRNVASLDLSRGSLKSVGEFFVGSVAARPSEPQEIHDEMNAMPPRLREVVELDARALTLESMSLVVDVAIFLAETLREGYPSLSWELWKKRRSVQFHRPVLVGFERDIPFDPLLVTTNIAWGALEGTEDGSALQYVYDRWAAQVRPGQ